VFDHHVKALGAGDLDGIVEDYTDDAIFITPAGIKRGKSGVREGFVQLLSDLPNAEWHVKPIFEDDGLDTFIFRDGLIRVQTVRYTVQPKS
jgi:ketosteroid isomerase-like protein